MKPRVAVVHPRLVAGGGSEACVMWTLQALRDDCRLSLITTGSPDIPAMNAKYGTNLDPAEIDARCLPIPFGMKKRFDALRGFGLFRYCRRHAHEFDAMISGYNGMDFGRPGIQRIADFSFDDALRRELHPASGAAGGAFGRSLYLGLARLLEGGRADGWKRNLTLANSEWTRDLLRERFGVESRVVYPPVEGDFPEVPWAGREDGFVFIGRLVPEKGLGLVVDVLSRVRRERDVHLHVVGRRGRTAYAREVEELCRRHGDWIRLEGEVYGPDKAALLAGHKFGLSGCRNEAFGIAVAEMVKAGEIVWVPSGGGQQEIVARPGLIYSDPGEAARKILAVLADPETQSAIRRGLGERTVLFSTAHFAEGMRDAVLGFLKENHAGSV
ncbi:MAG: glycosyltransferase family 4 protein [Acidobacteriota bacterium]